MIKYILCIITVCQLIIHAISANANDLPRKVNELKAIKRSIIRIATITPDNSDYNLEGTGFLLNHNNLIYLVTAKHVIKDKQNIILVIQQTDKEYNAVAVNDIISTYNVNWVYHENNSVDIALIPFFYLPLKKSDSMPEIYQLSIDKTMKQEYLTELMEVYFVSYFPGNDFRGKPLVLRDGVVSLVNDDLSFLIDCTTMPGNSGSPVFIKPTSAELNTFSGFIYDADDTTGNLLIGIIGGYFHYSIDDKTKDSAIEYEVNTGLTYVYPIDFVFEIFESDEVQLFEKTLKGRLFNDK